MKTLLILLFSIVVAYANALHDAVIAIDEKRVHSLVEEGMDVNALDDNGKTPLHLAAPVGRYTLVEYLIEKGSDPFIKDDFHKTALTYAIEKNRVRVTFYLSKVMNSSEPKHQDELFLAVQKGRVEYVKLFLHVLGINRQNRDGKTALHLASEKGDEKMVKMLLELGVDKSIRDFDGRDALSYAKLTGNKSLIELLQDTNGSE